MDEWMNGWMDRIETKIHHVPLGGAHSPHCAQSFGFRTGTELCSLDAETAERPLPLTQVNAVPTPRVRSQSPSSSPGHCLQQSVGLARTGWAQASRGHCTFSQCTSPVPPCGNPMHDGCQGGAGHISLLLPPTSFPTPMKYMHGVLLRVLGLLYTPELKSSLCPTR